MNKRLINCNTHLSHWYFDPHTTHTFPSTGCRFLFKSVGSQYRTWYWKQENKNSIIE